MKIKELSIAELKAAYDFILIDLADLKKGAEKSKANVEEIPAYNEVKEMESIIYHELLNRTRNLK